MKVLDELRCKQRLKKGIKGIYMHTRHLCVCARVCVGEREKEREG